MSIDWRQRECDGESARRRHRSIRATLKRHEWWRQRTLTRWTLTETQHVSVYCFTSTGIRLTLRFFSLPPINNLHLNVIDDDLSPVIQEYYSNTSITWILQIPVCSDQNNKTTKMKTKTHSVIMWVNWPKKTTTKKNNVIDSIWRPCATVTCRESFSFCEISWF